MKKHLLLKRLLFLWVFAFSASVWAQSSESFTNIPASSASYANRSWTGDNALTWTATLARTDQTMTGKAICTNGNGTVTSPTVAGGIAILTFDYVRGFTGTGARSVSVYVNGVQVGSAVSVNASSDVVQSYTSPPINVIGNIVVELRTSGTQIKIDNISWTGYSSTAPNLSISPATLNHGSSCLNTSATPVQYTITNNGTVAADGVTAVSSGTNASDFVVSGLTSNTIAAGGTANFNVTFTPSASGARSATITVATTTTGGNSPTLALTGTGNTPVAGAVSTNAESNVSSSAVRLNGNLNTLGTCPATAEKGFVWGSSSNPTSGDNIVPVASLATGPFNYDLAGLTPNNTYHYRAYVKDANNSYIYGADEPFTTLGVADHIVFVNVPASGNVNSNLSPFTVEARTNTDLLDAAYTGNVTLSIASGAGTISGTVTKSFVNGVATFNDIKFDAISNYTLHGDSGTFSQITSSNINVVAAVIYTKINSLAELTDGEYLIADAGSAVIMTNSIASGAVVTTISNANNGKITNPASTNVWNFVKTGSNYVIQNASSSNYLNYISSTNLSLVPGVTTDNQKWAITYSTDHFSVVNVFDPSRLLKYNSALTTPGFKAYTTATTSPEVALYKKITSTTWSGSSWSNGDPSAGISAIIDGDYNSGSFESQSLTVNAGKTLTVTGYVKTGNAASNGTIVVNNDANFVQTGVFTPGTGSSFLVKRDSKPVKRLDYISWSSPLSASTQTLKVFSYGKNADNTNQSVTGTTDTRFYTYNNGNFVSVSPTGSFVPAQGFQIRTPNDFTTTPQVFHGVFEGTAPNTGTVTYDASSISGQYVFLGNPYPGALDLQAFNTANPQVTGTFYIWNSSAPMDANGNYTGSNYYTYTQSGSNPAGAVNGYATAGQGFFVDRGVNTINSFTFNEGMRSASATGIFAKGATADRFWLELSAPSGAKPQLLIAFNPNATPGIDAGYDGKMIDQNGNSIYTVMDNNPFVIDTHGSFMSDDVFSLNAQLVETGAYTIGLVQKEGIFNTGQKIYLKDKLTGTVTDLTAGGYQFNAIPGLQENRFTVEFLPGAVLATGTAAKNELLVYSTNGTVTMKSPEIIKTVEIYDMAGKLLTVSHPLKSDTSLTISYRGVVVAKVTLQSGSVSTRKLMLK